MAGSTITTTITSSVTLGYGVFLSPLSVAPGGLISASGYGIYIYDVAGGGVVNSGTVSGSDDGVYLRQSSATITNKALLEGTNAAIRVQNYAAGEALIANSGTLTGRAGITGQLANVTNSGVIYGSNFGIDLQLSTLANTGTITGETGIYLGDGTLSNHGSIHGRATGLTIAGGEAINFGGISGGIGTGAAADDLIGGSGETAGSLINYGGISGGAYGVYVGGGFRNAGSVTGRTGLRVGIGGAASNSSVIYGSAYGAALFGQTSLLGQETLINSGSISGGKVGVTLGIRASLLNAGTIYGPSFGVAIYNGYLANSGEILHAHVGVTLSGGTLDNTGTIAAAADGVAETGAFIANYGTIYGAAIGAVITGGSLANFQNISGVSYGVLDTAGNVANYGVIASAHYGLLVSRATITNAGTISGALDAIEGSVIDLVVEPSAAFIGKVIDNSGDGVLDLGGAGVGTLGGIGSQITGFKEISFTPGPQWSIEGNEAGLAEGETISGFARSDTILLDGFSASSEKYVENAGLELGNGVSTITLDITGSFSSGGLLVTESGGQTTISNVTCFAEGTRIATPGGEIAVEALKIGDLVTTLHAGAQPVKWIGRSRYAGGLIRGNRAALPIRIKAGAIADRVPARDLRVSPGHAISFDGVLVHANRLVNGVSIVQEEAVAQVTYFHVELENHEILLAEGCPAESFMGEHFRRRFDNAREFARLYPGQKAPGVMCQPRLDSGFLLYAIQRRIRARAGLRESRRSGRLRGYVDQAGPKICFGWARDEATPETPVSLDIFNRGMRIGRVLANLYREDVAAAGEGDGYQGFEFHIPDGIIGAIEIRRSADGSPLERAAGAQAIAAMRAA